MILIPKGLPWATLTWLCLVAGTVGATPGRQAAFPTPDQAVDALIAANRASDTAAMVRILGAGGSKLVRSGDPQADKAGRERFVAAYDEAHHIELSDDRGATLIVGNEKWPFPIPLVHGASGWRYDTLAAEREILDRRIGRNELSVISVCREYVQAQREYAALSAAGGGKATYALRFASHPNEHDGLYWEPRNGEPASPFGPLVAQAQATGYEHEPPIGNLTPYHGYYYRILTRQGPHAPGGARSYVSDGLMTGGYALLAYPAVYGDSGIMTFIVSHDGIVYEKNLGPHTSSAVAGIGQYDPDLSWHAPKVP